MPVFFYTPVGTLRFTKLKDPVTANAQKQGPMDNPEKYNRLFPNCL